MKFGEFMIWLGRLLALCFLYRIIEPLVPSLKKHKASEIIHNITDPVYAIVLGLTKEVIPVKEDKLIYWINGICIFGILLLARIMDFII